MKKLIYFLTAVTFLSCTPDPAPENKVEKVVDEPKITVTALEREYTQNWREPNNEEFATLSKLMMRKNIRGCGEYFIIDDGRSEYVIACTSDGETFKYYAAWPKVDEIGWIADEDITIYVQPRQ